MDTEKRNKRQYQWQKENTDRINFTMPKGTKERIKKAALSEGVTPSEYIRQAIEEKLEGKNQKKPETIRDEITREPFVE